MDFFNSSKNDYRIVDLIKVNKIKPNSILEIGCANGIKLNEYQINLNSRINYGIDLSSKAIKSGKKRFKKLKLIKMSSLEIEKIKIKFDLIICGFFLYLLDREEIFQLNKNGYLIIQDCDPLFKHTNSSVHNKNLKTFKMSYDSFLEESGLFKVIYKIRNNTNLMTAHDTKNFKSEDTAITLFKKIDFIKAYPENV